MSTPFIAEIKIFGGNFAPRQYAFCNGQLISIAQNTALFSLVGTTYGGNGTTNFGLPDLQGRAPMGPRLGPGLTNRDLGEKSGEASVTLLSTQLPAHTHTVVTVAKAAEATADRANASGNILAPTTDASYATSASNASMGPTTPTGNGQPHNNMQPYLAISFIIALQGIFPARN
jgi:microcystin-dependent protein